MKKRNNAQLFGGLFVALFVGIFGCIIFLSSSKSVSQKTVLFLVSDNQAEGLIRAVDLFYKQYPDLAKKVEVIIRTRSNTEKDDPIPPSDIMVVKVLELPFLEQHLDYIKQANRSFAPAGTPTVRLAMGHPGTKYTDEDYESFGMRRDPQVEAYYDNGAPEDWKKMLGYLLNRYGNFSQVAVEKSEPKPTDGLAVFKNGQVVKLVKTWEEWEKEQKPDPKKTKSVYLFPVLQRKAVFCTSKMPLGNVSKNWALNLFLYLVIPAVKL